MQANDLNLNEGDLESLELYLDHELADGDVRRLDERLAVEPMLATTLDRMRGQRSLRLAAMSTAFDTDAASIERLVASVRVANANEVLGRRRLLSWAPMRSAFAAAACVAVGLLLGVTLQNRHGGAGLVAAPAVMNTGAFLGTDVNLRPHGAYVVRLNDANGREVIKVRFPTEAQARQFIDRINSGKGDRPMQVGDARILDEPY